MDYCNANLIGVYRLYTRTPLAKAINTKACHSGNLPCTLHTKDFVLCYVKVNIYYEFII